ncbi:MAG TPA: CvpA family protein [Alphaproteobacteria bacterium]|nr:CvpA family protein [Alphaproteobacteria bacterium]
MQVLGFYLIDLIVLGVVLLSGIFALARGLVREVLAIFSWVGAAFATFYGYELVNSYTQRLIGDPLIANIVTGAGIFLIVLFVLSLIAGAISGAVRGTAAGSVDRTLGFVFGLARGAVLVCIVYLALSFMIPPKEQPAWLQEARSAPLMAKGADFLYSLAPAHIRNGGSRPNFERSANGTRPAAAPAQSSANPTAPAAPNQGPGYKPDERREMDRLIEGTQ